jgi:hypothetical protein
VYGGPTIREFLAGIFNRPATAPHTDAASSHSEAAVTPEASGPHPTPSLPSDTVSGSIDALFSGATSDRGDALAASTLADAFAADSPETAPLRGMPAHRAASELSLDHVFKNTSAHRSSGEVDRKSFDQFFSEEPPPLPTNGESSAGAAPDDDAQHFNSWLSGLKKP